MKKIKRMWPGASSLLLAVIAMVTTVASSNAADPAQFAALGGAIVLAVVWLTLEWLGAVRLPLKLCFLFSILACLLLGLVGLSPSVQQAGVASAIIWPLGAISEGPIRVLKTNAWFYSASYEGHTVQVFPAVLTNVPFTIAANRVTIASFDLRTLRAALGLAPNYDYALEYEILPPTAVPIPMRSVSITYPTIPPYYDGQAENIDAFLTANVPSEPRLTLLPPWHNQSPLAIPEHKIAQNMESASWLMRVKAVPYPVGALSSFTALNFYTDSLDLTPAMVEVDPSVEVVRASRNEFVLTGPALAPVKFGSLMQAVPAGQSSAVLAMLLGTRLFEASLTTHMCSNEMTGRLAISVHVEDYEVPVSDFFGLDIVITETSPNHFSVEGPESAVLSLAPGYTGSDAKLVALLAGISLADLGVGLSVVEFDRGLFRSTFELLVTIPEI